MILYKLDGFSKINNLIDAPIPLYMEIFCCSNNNNSNNTSWAANTKNTILLLNKNVFQFSK